MRTAHLPRLKTLASALALGALSLGASLVWAVPPASAASGPADPEASEYVRLINGVRAANGLGALRVDPVLAGLARDTPMSCPADAIARHARTSPRRRREQLRLHRLRLCPDVKFVSVLQTTYGYGNVGEIMCRTAAMATGSSCQLHRDRLRLYDLQLLHDRPRHTRLDEQRQPRGHHRGGYDRVGCGGWISGSGTFYYDCVFSSGGPNGTDPTADSVAVPGQSASCAASGSDARADARADARSRSRRSAPGRGDADCGAGADRHRDSLRLGNPDATAFRGADCRTDLGPHVGCRGSRPCRRRGQCHSARRRGRPGPAAVRLRCSSNRAPATPLSCPEPSPRWLAWQPWCCASHTRSCWCEDGAVGSHRQVRAAGPDLGPGRAGQRRPDQDHAEGDDHDRPRETEVDFGVDLMPGQHPADEDQQQAEDEAGTTFAAPSALPLCQRS